MWKSPKKAVRCRTNSWSLLPYLHLDQMNRMVLFLILLTCMCIQVASSFPCGQPTVCECDDYDRRIVCNNLDLTFVPYFPNVVRYQYLDLKQNLLTKIPILRLYKKFSLIDIRYNDYVMCNLLFKDMKEYLIPRGHILTDCINPEKTTAMISTSVFATSDMTSMIYDDDIDNENLLSKIKYNLKLIIMISISSIVSTVLMLVVAFTRKKIVNKWRSFCSKGKKVYTRMPLHTRSRARGIVNQNFEETDGRPSDSVNHDLFEDTSVMSSVIQ